ncbi:MAG: hypothetical protein R3C01_08470 [Planctomycetaceae bacterium]
MSQLMDSPPLPEHRPDQTMVESRVSSGEGYGDFSYTPTPMSAVVSAILATLSLTVFVVPLPGAFLGILATLLGAFSLYRIVRARGELGGKKFALFAIIVAPLCAAGGLWITSQRYQNELPEGHRRVNFSRDIAQKKIGTIEDKNGRRLAIHPDVGALIGQEIFVKGFMYPTKRTHHLTEFLLCKDNAQCCFGGEPPLTDMIGVKLGKDLTANYDVALTAVAGKLYLNPKYRGEANEPLYMLDATKVETAQTGF